MTAKQIIDAACIVFSLGLSAYALKCAGECQYDKAAFFMAFAAWMLV
ncbi:hypothetical protein [Tardibacter chloracetimidivorans]|nr:hypothetical protein [Tardibacter chloracetimidivorans]